MQATKATTPGGCRPSCFDQSEGRPGHGEEGRLRGVCAICTLVVSSSKWNIFQDQPSRYRILGPAPVPGTCGGISSAVLCCPKSPLRVCSSGTLSSAVSSPCFCPSMFLPVSSSSCLRVGLVGNCSHPSWNPAGLLSSAWWKKKTTVWDIGEIKEEWSRAKNKKSRKFYQSIYPSSTAQSTFFAALQALLLIFFRFKDLSSWKCMSSVKYPSAGRSLVMKASSRRKSCHHGNACQLEDLPTFKWKSGHHVMKTSVEWKTCHHGVGWKTWHHWNVTQVEIGVQVKVFAAFLLTYYCQHVWRKPSHLAFLLSECCCLSVFQAVIKAALRI